MKFNTALLSAVLFAVGTVNAQSSSAPAPSSTAGISACILGCLNSAVSSGGCSSFTDVSCVCTNTTFQKAAQSCLTSKCSSADQAAALQLQQSECANVASSSKGSGSSSATSPASSSTSAAASSTASKSAARAMVNFESGGLVAGVVAIAGAVAGAGLVL